MKRISKKILAVLLMTVMVFGCVPAVYGAVKDALSVEIITDKEEYAKGEEAKITLKFTNTGNTDVTNINGNITIPEGIKLSEGCSTKVTLSKLMAGTNQEVALDSVEQNDMDDNDVDENKTSSGNVPTGDNTSTAIYVLMAIVAVVAVIMTVAKKKDIKKATGISVMVIAFAAIGAMMSTDTEAAEKSVTAEKTIKVDGEEAVITAVVTFDVEEEESTEATEKETTTAGDEEDETTITGDEATKVPDMTTEKITLTYLNYDSDVLTEKLAEKFEEKYPNITVELVNVTAWEADETLLKMAKNNQTPDCFMYTCCDYVLENGLLGDMTLYWKNDEENKNLIPTIDEAKLGYFGTNKKLATPMKFFPGIIFIDKNCVEKLNLEMPSTDWTWDEMIQLIKDATGIHDGKQYYGLGVENRLDTFYNIAASQDIIGDFGFDGEKFDLSAWAVGEQMFADLKLNGYVAPDSDTQAMENWLGDWSAWAGSSGQVAIMTESYSTYLSLFAYDHYKNEVGVEFVPYPIPSVEKVDGVAHSSAEMYFGGISSTTEHPREAYELLKFMGWGVDGWKARMEIYHDETITNAEGDPLIRDSLPAPITMDEDIWADYKTLFYDGSERDEYWDAYFEKCVGGIPFGYTYIPGFWHFCDEYFNELDIHTLVDKGYNKASDFVDEVEEMANKYYTEAIEKMQKYFEDDATTEGDTTTEDDTTADGEVAGMPDMTTEKITLTYLNYDSDVLTEKLAEKFEEKYPNITVELINVDDSEAEETLLKMAKNNQTPDCFMYTYCDYVLENGLLGDMTLYWDNDEENKKLIPTIDEAKLGYFGTEKKLATPMKFFPGIIYIDKNVVEYSNLEMPSADWTWDEMIQLIKLTTRKPDRFQYYGLCAENRLATYYNIAASQDIIGDFGFDGEKFDLSAWAVGEQMFADLKLNGYVAPDTETQAMEDWLGDWEAWAGSSGHVAIMTSEYWTYLNLFANDYYKNDLGIEFVPYPIPSVEKVDGVAHSSAIMDFGGISSTTEHPREAYELLKFMGWGVDGWKARMEIYHDETITNAEGDPLIRDSIPAPITMDEDIWADYKTLFYDGSENDKYWDAYFEKCVGGIPQGDTYIPGYWYYCDEYFDLIGVYELVESGRNHASDFVDETTELANRFYTEAMDKMENYFENYPPITDDKEEEQPNTGKDNVLEEPPTVQLPELATPEELPAEPFAHITFDGETDEGYIAVTQEENSMGWGATYDLVPTDTELLYCDGPVDKCLYIDGKFGLDLGLKPTNTEQYTISFWMNADRLATFGPTLQLGYNMNRISDCGEDVTWLCVTQLDMDNLDFPYEGKMFPVIWSRSETGDAENGTDCWPWMSTFDNTRMGKREWIMVTIVCTGEEQISPVTGCTYAGAELYINGMKYYDSEDIYANNTNWAEWIWDATLAPNIMKPTEGAEFKALFGINYWDTIFKGYVDDLYVYDTALTSGQVTSLYMLGVQ